MHKKPLVLALALALTLPALALAQESSAEDAEEAAKLTEVIVTGTRRSDRTVAESMAPIDVLRPVELENSGTPELQAVLNRLVPSFNFPRTSITDASDHVRPAQLRGLAPDQTLVLVNGKRRHRTAIINVNGTQGRGSSPVDLNAIPVGAIERIEVLRDGAAAQYGSDAIAGVINVVLKNDAEGGFVSGTSGRYDEGDGDLLDVSGNIGFGLGEGGFVNLTAQFRDKEATNRAGLDRRQQYPLINGRPDPREASFDRLNHRFGDAATADQLLFLNAAMPVGESGHELYGFGSLSRRDGESAGFYRRALDVRNVPAIYPDGFLPLINSDVYDKSLVLGVRGGWGDWAYDFSLNRGYSKFVFTISDSVNTNLGVQSPVYFNAGSLTGTQTAVNFDVNNGFDVGFLVSPLSVALGAEFRRESFEIGEGEPASYFGTGSQVFPGFRPSDAGRQSRRNWAFYIDLEGDVSDSLTLGAAVRHEDYTDFGAETSGKLSARFAINDAVALRGSASTGFRAPNLQQQFYSTTATNFIGNVPFDIRTFAVTNPVAQALGAEALKAETSGSLSLGLTADLFDGLNFTLDWYRIDIDDRIILSENLTGTAVRNFLAARGFAGTDGGRYFTNAVDTRTTGFDLVGRYRYGFESFGDLQLTLGYNRGDTDIERIAPNPVVLTQGGLNLQRVGRVEIGRLTVSPPKDKLNLGVDWNWGALSLQTSTTRYGEWTVLNSNPLLDQTFDAKWVADLSLSWDFASGIKATAGVENLFDTYPQQMQQDLRFDANGFATAGPLDNTFTGILPYARGEAPFGFNGRFYYARLRYAW
ncbi:MAG: TonB-dependent receptor [Xanthomonadales bacterium]|nr:TonB-dependent receptor [Xanthomonadales bacterium]